MHTHFSLWKGGEPLFAGGGYAGLSDMALHAIGGVLKHAASIIGIQQSDDEQLQATGPRLRSPGESGLFAAKSFGGVPHSDVQPEPEGQARRVPLPGSELQSVSRVLRDHDGRASMGFRTRSIPAIRSTRTCTTCRRKRPPKSPRLPVARRGTQRVGTRSRVPLAWRGLHQGLDRHVDRIQADATKSTPSACVRIRTNSACTSISKS